MNRLLDSEFTDLFASVSVKATTMGILRALETLSLVRVNFQFHHLLIIIHWEISCASD